MRQYLLIAVCFVALATAGCSTKNGAINTCSYEVDKLMLPWINPDGRVFNLSAYEFREANLLFSCMKREGYVYDNVRANAEYRAGRSLGLVEQYKDQKNWSFSWFGLVAEKVEEIPSSSTE